ncbi:hypothetical protein CMI37_21450 [Candidatus Pacearchaeota archaeon]|nr:hypothetical protein [Candidatus Pacearchaeota archaeon]|tara:strand:- start:763 stop:2091 length:1329 start_codon:yes stop_codon:yes gene_type:complete
MPDKKTKSERDARAEAVRETFDAMEPAEDVRRFQEWKSSAPGRAAFDILESIPPMHFGNVLMEHPDQQAARLEEQGIGGPPIYSSGHMGRVLRDGFDPVDPQVGSTLNRGRYPQGAQAWEQAKLEAVNESWAKMLEAQRSPTGNQSSPVLRRAADGSMQQLINGEWRTLPVPDPAEVAKWATMDEAKPSPRVSRKDMPARKALSHANEAATHNFLESRHDPARGARASQALDHTEYRLGTLDDRAARSAEIADRAAWDAARASTRDPRIQRLNQRWNALEAQVPGLMRKMKAAAAAGESTRHLALELSNIEGELAGIEEAARMQGTSPQDWIRSDRSHGRSVWGEAEHKGTGGKPTNMRGAPAGIGGAIAAAALPPLLFMKKYADAQELDSQLEFLASAHDRPLRASDVDERTLEDLALDPATRERLYQTGIIGTELYEAAR